MTRGGMRYFRGLTVTVGLIGGGLGFLGFWTDHPCEGASGSLREAALQTLRLFTLNVDPKDLCNPQTWWASFLAPVFSAGVLIIAFSRLFFPWWHARMLWFRPADDLFLGGGDTAAAIARRWQHASPAGALRRRKTVGLDPRPEAPLTLAMEEGWKSAFTFAGDALSNHDLERVNAARARNVWVTTGDDLRNLEVARRVSLLAGSAQPEGSDCRLLVHLRDRHLARASRSAFRSSAVHTEYFNMPRLAARALLRRHPPPYLAASGNRRTRDEPMHLCIVGADDLACAIVTHAAVHCVYDEAPAACVRITLVGTGADERYRDILRRHPVLDPGTRTDPRFADVLPIAHLQSLDCDESEITPGAWRALQALAPFAIVYVAAGDDLSTRSAALRVAALRDSERPNAGTVPRILECRREASASSLSTVVNDAASFDIWDECLDARESYPGEHADDVAKAIWFFGYEVERDQRIGDESRLSEAWRASKAKWATREEELRWSDRYAADHIAVKLRLVGLEPDEFGPGTMTEAREWPLATAIQASIDFLAGVEHRRFLVERLMDGWLPFPEAWIREQLAGDLEYSRQFPSRLDYGKQKELLKLNRTLLPLSAFPDSKAGDDEKEKDRAQVRAIPECLMVAKAVRSV